MQTQSEQTKSKVFQVWWSDMELYDTGICGLCGRKWTFRLSCMCHACGLSCLQVYLFAEALAEGAVKMGMPSALAHSIATQTVLVIFTTRALWFHCKCNVSSFHSWHSQFMYVLLQGAGRLLRDSGKHPAQLRSEVCTPGGTTIFGLHTLEQGGVRAATMSAVESATERARELGRKSSTACLK